MPRLPSVPPMLSHVTASESNRDSAVVTCEMCSLDVAVCTISRSTRRTASACGTHAPIHAPTQRGRHACRAHGRTSCTQELPRWPISARARPGSIPARFHEIRVQGNFISIEISMLPPP
eukprot:5100532-Prymnesium_polylepis.1